VTTTFPPGPGTDEAARPSWREERRQDRLTQAEAAERHADARQKRQFAAADKARQLKAADREAKRTARLRGRQDRASQLTAAAQWCRSHVGHLLMIPVIAVPGALAATGQADWGMQQWGPIGFALPAFSEGSMWVFAAKTTAARKAGPDAPVWHLRLGTIVFALVGGALNFVHGMAQGGVWSGVTMALTSVSGVTAHQITTAGPRKTRQQRRADRLARKTARKERRAQEAAVAAGIVVIGSDGQARVTVRPGAAALRRRWPMRTQLVPERDVQAEINDITETALLLVTRAEAAAGTAHDQSERFAEAVRETRQQAARQAGEADAARQAAEARAREAQRRAEAAITDAEARATAAGEEADRRAAEARELTEQARRTAEAALARATAADARTAQVEAETRARLERAARETAQRIEQAERKAAQEATETGKVRAAWRTATQELDTAGRQLERARIAERDALARAKAAEETITQAQARQKRPGETKKDHLLRLYQAHPDYGIPAAASKTATELAAELDYSAGSARRDVRAHLIKTGALAAETPEAESENAA
jgi:hypothetical protein